MRKIIFSIIALLMPLGAAFAQGKPNVTGKWKLDDGSAIVEVYQQGNVYNGKIVWLAEPTEADGTPAKDLNNPDKSLRSRQLIGLNMLSGLKKSGNEYKEGKIYDPGNGKTDNCSMKLEGDVLKVRGSLDKRGLLGRTMDWFRVK